MAIDYWHEFISDHIYHVYNHAVSDQNLFISDEDYVDFLAKYKKYIAPFVDTYAYCIMPNHFHLLFKVKSYDKLVRISKLDPTNARLKLIESESYVNEYVLSQWKRMLSSYAISYNNRHKRRGQLFLKRMKRVSIDKEQRFSNLLSYIHHNPIHHNFCSDYYSWKYSSYKVYSQSIKHTALDVQCVLNWFGGKAKFLNYHNEFKLIKKEDNLD